MEFRKLGRTDIDLSVMGFSSYGVGDTMWGNAEKKDMVAAIHAALDHGINAIDTAPFYGLGRSERLIGEAIKGRDRSKIRLMTKFGMVWDGSNLGRGTYFFSVSNEGNKYRIYKYASRENVFKEVEESLKRLKVDYVDLLQLHWPDATTPIAETLGAIQDLISQGKVRAAGFCNDAAAPLNKAPDTSGLVSHRVHYSMLNRAIEHTVLPRAVAQNKGIMAYSPLERGLLSGRYFVGRQPAVSGHPDRYFQKFDLNRVRGFLNRITPLAKDHRVSLSQLVLKWTSLQPGITTVLEGARNKDQAISNARAVGLRLSESELQFINREVAKMPVWPKPLNLV